MKEMTDEEAIYWDNYYTENTVMPDLTQPGYFARNYGMPIILDSETTCNLTAYAKTVRKSPSEIIAEMVREKIAVGA